LRDWQAYEQKIHEHATMVPHYAHFNAVGQESELKNSNDCICGGKYCAPDPGKIVELINIYQIQMITVTILVLMFYKKI